MTSPPYRLVCSPILEYADTLIELQAGDRLYLYTDGLYEERNIETREQFGRERMRDELCAASAGPFVSSLDGLIQVHCTLARQ